MKVIELDKVHYLLGYADLLKETGKDEWIPGFELHLNQLFYGERCRTCRRPMKQIRRCEVGLSDRPLDPEYDEYVREAVKRVLEGVKPGLDPTQIAEFRVLQPLQDLWVKLRKTAAK